MVETSIMVMCVASLLAEPVAEPVAEPTPAPASPDIVETSPPTEATEPAPPITPEPAALPQCRREDFESFDDYVRCRSQATGVAPRGPFSASTAPPVRPSAPDPAYTTERHRAIGLQAAGGVMFGLGMGSLGSAWVLNNLHWRSYTKAVYAGGPGPLGFPEGHWRDVAMDYRRAERLHIASLVTLSTGAVLVLSGTVCLIVGASWKRWANRHTIEVIPGGLSLRW